MDDFNNFFDDQRDNEQHEKTPIYHTPEPPKNNNSTGTTIAIVLSVVMCLVVIINVIVLASLKSQIADKYAASLSSAARAEYYNAINDVLDDSDIVSDVKDVAAEKAAAALTTEVGQVANSQCAMSVARIYMYTSASATKSSGLATAFLITDATSESPERYLVTNAHCARYIKKTETTHQVGWQIFSDISYAWSGFEKITCFFENDETAYSAEVVAYGSYEDTTYKDEATFYGISYPAVENNQADLAILKITGTQPSNTEHPSLKIVSETNSPVRGTDVAIIGNPQGIGETNSIAVGAISQVGITISSWGAGSFVMTDAAVNGGNSGGPMINKSGYVVGVVESKLVSTDIENMGFALDAKTLNSFIQWVQTQKGISINYTVI
ncbi:MAG: serine protease [Clostridia bacterium]|nr:serine protease [Clostridia bacterium]